jgi:formyl-CoA transferase
LWWPIQSRNKRCVTCDLSSARGRELFLELLGTSDVLLENFRPGTLDRWGLDPAALESCNRKLIVCRVSGYGQTGPYAARAGFASVAEAMGGLRHINGFPGELPPRMQISLGDSLAALFAALGVLAALYRRDARSGDAQEIDVSLVESCFALLESTAPEYDLLGLVRGPGGVGLGGLVPSSLFRSRDGKLLIIAANSDRLFRRLCEAMRRPELVDDERFATHRARAEHREAVESAISAWAGEHAAAEITEVLSEAGVVCGPIYTIADIFEDPHFQDRGMLLEHHDEELGTFKGPGVVPRFSRTPGAVRWSGPWEPGAHNDEVYGGVLGLGEAALAELRSAKII